MTQATIDVLKALVNQRQAYLRAFNGTHFEIEAGLYAPILVELEGLSEQRRINAKNAAQEYEELEKSAMNYVVTSGTGFLSSPGEYIDPDVIEQRRKENAESKPKHESGLLMKGDAKLEARLVKYEARILEKLNKLGGMGHASDLRILVGNTQARGELNVAVNRLVKARRITRTEMVGRKVVYTLPGLDAEDPNRDPGYRNIVALAADWDGDKAGLIDLLMDEETVINMGWDKGDLCRILKSERNFIERLRVAKPGEARYKFLQRHYGLGVGK